MPELGLIANIAAALSAAFVGGIVARRLGLPTLVGYLLAGVAIGPFTPGFVGDAETIGQLAELGVIFLMFGVGLQFALHDLWAVRDIAIPGALAQMIITAALGYGLSQLWGWPAAAGLTLGLTVCIASTVVLLRGLMDNALLNTGHGHVAVGWLVMQDVVTVAILVMLPAFARADSEALWPALGLTLLKAGGFVGLMFLVGARFVPWVLLRIAHTQSRELFILVILVIALGTAFGSAELFGVSLALGAFVAGVIINASPFSRQAAADVLPFREAFSVLFFVSVGMLIDPRYLVAQAGPVLALTAFIVIGKAALTALIGFFFPYPARTALVLGVGNAHIGEFSFLLGQAALGLALLNRDHYALILAGALLSITLNPLLFRALAPVEAFLRRFPNLWRLLDRHGPSLPPVEEGMSGHVVIVGCGRVGQHMVEVLGHLHVPRLVIEVDARRVSRLGELGIPTLFGDAANSEVLKHARLEHARALVVTLPDEAAAEIVIATARQLAPALPIVARAATQEGVGRLAAFAPRRSPGALVVVHPELEGGLEIVRHTLLLLNFSPLEVQKYTDAMRFNHYGIATSADKELQALDQLIGAARTITIAWFRLTADSPLVGQTVAEADLRARTGASVVAIWRDQTLIANPKSLTPFQAGDLIGLIGEAPQIEMVKELLSASNLQEQNVLPPAE